MLPLIAIANFATKAGQNWGDKRAPIESPLGGSCDAIARIAVRLILGRVATRPVSEKENG
jgi:hypothetical protein